MTAADFKEAAKKILQIDGLPDEVRRRAGEVLKSSVPELAFRRLMLVSQDALQTGGLSEQAREALLEALRGPYRSS